LEKESVNGEERQKRKEQWPPTRCHLTRFGLQNAVKKGGIMRPISYIAEGKCRKSLH
jgi:hypothetical protein